MNDGTSEADGRSTGLPMKQVAAVAAGNALEFYDFLTYAFFAVYIGRTFFPSDDPQTSLLASLATYGAGFLTRPLGAFVIGRLADRVGRKPMMLLSFGLMGIAMVGMALTPSYASIGVAAPILVVMFRLVQGFALGGEVGPSTAFLVEAAPLHRRGLYVSLQFAGQDSAVLAAGLMGVLLSSVMDSAELSAWGWRIAFLVGAAIIPVGLMLRRSLEETLALDPERPVETRPPLRSYSRIAILGLLMLIALTVAGNTMTYLTTYSIATLHMPERIAFGAIVVVGLCGLVFDPVGGWLSDRFGRKPVMIVPWVFLSLAVIPAFWIISQYRSAAALYGATALLQIANAIASSSVLVAITETLPRLVRSGSLALIYAFAISVFGGTTHFIISALTHVTGNPLAPAWYMAAAAGLGLAAMVLIRESAPSRAGPIGQPAGAL